MNYTLCVSSPGTKNPFYAVLDAFHDMTDALQTVHRASYSYSPTWTEDMPTPTWDQRRRIGAAIAKMVCAICSSVDAPILARRARATNRAASDEIANGLMVMIATLTRACVESRLVAETWEAMNVGARHDAPAKEVVDDALACITPAWATSQLRRLAEPEISSVPPLSGAFDFGMLSPNTPIDLALVHLSRSVAGDHQDVMLEHLERALNALLGRRPLVGALVAVTKAVVTACVHTDVSIRAGRPEPDRSSLKERVLQSPIYSNMLVAVGRYMSFAGGPEEHILKFYDDLWRHGSELTSYRVTRHPLPNHADKHGSLKTSMRAHLIALRSHMQNPIRTFGPRDRYRKQDVPQMSEITSPDVPYRTASACLALAMASCEEVLDVTLATSVDGVLTGTDYPRSPFTFGGSSTAAASLYLSLKCPIVLRGVMDHRYTSPALLPAALAEAAYTTHVRAGLLTEGNRSLLDRLRLVIPKEWAALERGEHLNWGHTLPFPLRTMGWGDQRSAHHRCTMSPDETFYLGLLYLGRYCYEPETIRRWAREIGTTETRLRETVQDALSWVDDATIMPDRESMTFDADLGLIFYDAFCRNADTSEERDTVLAHLAVSRPRLSDLLTATARRTYTSGLLQSSYKPEQMSAPNMQYSSGGSITLVDHLEWNPRRRVMTYEMLFDNAQEGVRRCIKALTDRNNVFIAQEDITINATPHPGIAGIDEDSP